ncbi:MAG: pYEATS domain-containing protein [Nannocystaceae bacterium]
MIEDIDVKALRRTSHRAGALSLLGALIAFAGLAYAGLRLRAVQEEVQAVESRIAELKPIRDELEAAKEALTRDNAELTRLQETLKEEKLALEEERVKLTTEVESLRSERDRLREGYTATLALTNNSARLPSASRAAVDEIKETLPIAAVARPAASRELLADGRARYSVWLEFPANWGERCERVSYLFNHESFRAKNPSSTTVADGFKISYVGWGCLDSVVATVTLKNGGREKIVFDMCALLGRQGESVEKEPPARASAMAPQIDEPGAALERPAVKRPGVGGEDGAETSAGSTDPTLIQIPTGKTPGKPEKELLRPVKIPGAAGRDPAAAGG